MLNIAAFLSLPFRPEQDQSLSQTTGFSAAQPTSTDLLLSQTLRYLHSSIH